jgi:hypothetical protein
VADAEPAGEPAAGSAAGDANPFAAALSSSPFADQQAFLAALLDEETRQRLEQLKQTLENAVQQNNALALRARDALARHQQQPPADVDLTLPLEQVQVVCSSWRRSCGKTAPARERSANS